MRDSADDLHRPALLCSYLFDFPPQPVQRGLERHQKTYPPAQLAGVAKRRLVWPQHRNRHRRFDGIDGGPKRGARKQYPAQGVALSTGPESVFAQGLKSIHDRLIEPTLSLKIHGERSVEEVERDSVRPIPPEGDPSRKDGLLQRMNQRYSRPRGCCGLIRQLSPRSYVREDQASILKKERISFNIIALGRSNNPAKCSRHSGGSIRGTPIPSI